MTDLERQSLEARVRLAESRALLADVRTQFLVQIVTALRDTLAAHSPEFDAEFLERRASLVPLSVPSVEELSTPSKLHQLLVDTQKCLEELKTSLPRKRSQAL